jgi:hypothetical protein
MDSLTPLTFPDQWPPPSFEYIDDLTETSTVPLLGWFVRRRKRTQAKDKFYAGVLDPMERHIVDQLTARMAEYPWSDQDRPIAECLSKAIAYEKAIPPPKLHPDDCYGLVCWGAFDDLTPLIFDMNLKDRFGVDFSKEEHFAFWKDQSTLAHVFECFHAKLDARRSSK